MVEFITEATSKIIDGLYQAAIQQQQTKQNHRNHSRASATDKTSKLDSIIYAVFTTPQNAIPGSAVCAFRVQDIIDTFEGKTRFQLIHEIR